MITIEELRDDVLILILLILIIELEVCVGDEVVRNVNGVSAIPDEVHEWFVLLVCVEGFILVDVLLVLVNFGEVLLLDVDGLWSGEDVD